MRTATGTEKLSSSFSSSSRRLAMRCIYECYNILRSRALGGRKRDLHPAPPTTIAASSLAAAAAISGFVSVVVVATHVRFVARDPAR